MWREVRMSDERARFLEEESEERIKQDFLAGETSGLTNPNLSLDGGNRRD